MTMPIRTDFIPSRALDLDGATRPLEGASPGGDFTEVFTRVLNDAGQLQSGAQDMVAAFLRGEPVELHQVMAASEEAQLSLELLVELRNKLSEAYRSVMNLQ